MNSKLIRRSFALLLCLAIFQLSHAQFVEYSESTSAVATGDGGCDGGCPLPPEDDEDSSGSTNGVVRAGDDDGGCDGGCPLPPEDDEGSSGSTDGTISHGCGDGDGGCDGDGDDNPEDDPEDGDEA